MSIEKLLLLFLGLFFVGIPLAQKSKPIELGGKIPDVLLNNVLNYRDSVIHLSDFKNKAIILDFFTTHCGSCIEFLPHLDSLQQLLQDSLQIIVICSEPKKKINQFLSKRKLSTYKNLIFVTEDTVLQELFPHELIPHEVWIDKNRKVFNTTDASSLYYSNVSQWIATGYVDVDTKVDRRDFDRSKPLLALGKIPLLSQRIFTKHISGLPGVSGIVTDTLQHSKRVYYINSSLNSLIQTALSFPFRNRIIWKSSRLFNRDNDKGRQFRMNSYCSDIILPDTAKNEQFKKYLLEDISRSLAIRAYIDTQEIDCYKLVSLKSNLISRDSCYRLRGEDPIEGTYVVYNNRFSNELIEYINQYLDKPVVDDSSLNNRISVKFHTENLNNYTALRKELQSQGLDLVISTTRLPVIVVENP